ncbi:Hypothetical predicted protein [Paramuricea clavata]|uniref:Uncharacterized protein n=1 Tax=Paramuricea clavata TaxID=317549 RepID=A0A7D9E3V9_PARCT|nr:Hypothetical predicted protein [Paramuricea clavata]
MNSDDINFQEPPSQRGLQFNDAILNERIFSSKRSRAGFLGVITRVRGQIEILLSNVENAQTVQIQLHRYDDAWRKFEDTHNDQVYQRHQVNPHDHQHKKKRVQAAKAKLALRLAEVERHRVLEGEFRVQDIERKQRELETQQKLEEEELERTRRIETLKQAALANLEAQLQKQFDSYVEVDIELETEIGGRISSEPAEVISLTHLHEVQNPDKVTTDMATRYSSRTDTTYPSVFNSDPQHEGNHFPQRQLQLTNRLDQM